MEPEKPPRRLSAMNRAIVQASIAVSLLTWIIAFAILARVNGWSWRHKWWAVLIPFGIYSVGLLARLGLARWRDKK